ncbi:MAG: M28 family peptidase [Syntrophales bacterium]|nr:M28 family peptidase [Syntrophales bacterium]
MLAGYGWSPEIQGFPYEGRMYGNVIATIAGEKRAAETVVVGAHYDTVTGTPGADDNASGVAVLLELSRLLRGIRPDRTIKLVFFCLEEPPVFRTPSMGSFVYAERAKAAGERIAAMISLEMLGYYGTAEGGQAFPLPFMSLFFRTTPDFIAVVGNLSSRRLVGDVAASLRETGMAVETLATVSLVPGVDFSDHRSFWKMGYPAVMLTDTAFYRNPHYHASSDRADTLDYGRMAVLLDGLDKAIRALAGPA